MNELDKSSIASYMVLCYNQLTANLILLYLRTYLYSLTYAYILASFIVNCRQPHCRYDVYVVISIIYVQ